MKQPIIFISQQHNAPPPQKNRKTRDRDPYVNVYMYGKEKNNLRSVTIFILIYKDIVTKVIISEAV